MITTVDRWAGRVVELAVRLLPAGRRHRYARELVAELYGMPRAQQRRHALQVLTHAWALRAALVAAGPTPQEDTMTLPTRPLRCRLRLHRWDQRENPETGELYEVCLRCDAYRDRPGAVPGTSAASTTNTGMF